MLSSQMMISFVLSTPSATWEISAICVWSCACPAQPHKAVASYLLSWELCSSKSLCFFIPLFCLWNSLYIWLQRETLYCKVCSVHQKSFRDLHEGAMQLSKSLKRLCLLFGALTKKMTNNSRAGKRCASVFVHIYIYTYICMCIHVHAYTPVWFEYIPVQTGACYLCTEVCIVR